VYTEEDDEQPSRCYKDLPKRQAERPEIAARPHVDGWIKRIKAQLDAEKVDRDALKARWFRIGETLLEAKRELSPDEFGVAWRQAGIESSQDAD
jgi:hypothetical protein